MDRTRRHLKLAILCVPLLTLPVGCATPVSPAQIDCPSASSIDELSGIAVAAAPRRKLRLDATLAPESELDLGPLDYIAQVSAREGVGAARGLRFASPIGFVIGAIKGAAVGAARASDYSREHAATVEEINNALGGVDLQKWVEQQAVARLRNAFAVNTGALDRMIARVSGDDGAAVCGIHTLVEVRIIRTNLSRPSIQQFVVRPVVVAQVRLIATSDGTERFSERYEFKGISYNYDEARADGARLVREDFERGSRALAEQIVTPRFVRLAREPGGRDIDIARVEAKSGAPLAKAGSPSQPKRGAGEQVAGAFQALPPLMVDRALVGGIARGQRQ